MLTFIHFNCQSAMNKASEISALVDEQKPHVLALTEFGAGNMVTDGEIGTHGYTLYRGNHSSYIIVFAHDGIENSVGL